MTCFKFNRVGNIAARRPGINSNEPTPPNLYPGANLDRKERKGKKKREGGFVSQKGRAKGGGDKCDFPVLEFFLNYAQHEAIAKKVRNLFIMRYVV